MKEVNKITDKINQQSTDNKNKNNKDKKVTE